MRAPAAGPPTSAASEYLDQLRALREGRSGSVDLRIEGSQHTDKAAPGEPGPATPR